MEREQDEYIQNMIKQIQSDRKSRYCGECCIGYWLFLILSAVISSEAVKEECGYLGNVGTIFGSLCGTAAFLRIIDGCCIIIPLNKNTLSCSTWFHGWNFAFEYWITLIFLIVSTVLLFLNECEGYWNFVIGILILAWTAVIVWKCCFKNDDEK